MKSEDICYTVTYPLWHKELQIGDQFLGICTVTKMLINFAVIGYNREEAFLNLVILDKRFPACCPDSTSSEHIYPSMKVNLNDKDIEIIKYYEKDAIKIDKPKEIKKYSLIKPKENFLALEITENLSSKDFFDFWKSDYSTLIKWDIKSGLITFYYQLHSLYKSCCAKMGDYIVKDNMGVFHIVDREEFEKKFTLMDNK